MRNLHGCLRHDNDMLDFPLAHMKHFLEQPAIKHVRHLFCPARSRTSSRATMSWALFDAKLPQD